MTTDGRASPRTAGTDPDGHDPRGGLSVGAVAARLGVAPETVRSWGRRYGLIPSGRSAGGHRRFADEDVDRLLRMQRLVAEGTAPAAAARQVMAEQDPAVTGEPAPPPGREGSGRGGPGGRVLAVPGGSGQARGLARAASRLDADGIERILDRVLAERGAIQGWDEVMRPVLVAAGERWMLSGEGIEIEHMLSESVMAACWRHRRLQPPAHPGRPVLLACFPGDVHVLPLYVLAAALAEHRVPTRQFGARVPLAALIAASRRTGAAAAFVWRQIAVHGAEAPILLPISRPPVRLVVGGPGWAGATLDPATVVAADLREAVEILHAAAVG
jgi:DNA-binding transcriptional MerR regulator